MHGVVVVPFTPSDSTRPALGPPRSRPSTVSATRASSCPTLQRTSWRAMTSARSAWLSCRPMEPAYVSGARAAVWLARRAQAAAVTPERVGRSEPSTPRSGAPAARPVGGQAQSRVGRPGRVRGACIMSYSCAHPLRAIASYWLALQCVLGGFRPLGLRMGWVWGSLSRRPQPGPLVSQHVPSHPAATEPTAPAVHAVPAVTRRASRDSA